MGSADQELIASEMVGKGMPGTRVCLGTGRGHRQYMDMSQKKKNMIKLHRRTAE